MNNGAIFLWEHDKKKFNLADRAITFFTGSPYVHVAVYLDGYTYDSGIVWKPFYSGIRKWQSYPTGNLLIKTLLPKIPLATLEMVKMKMFAENSIKRHFPYNILKLLVLAIVYPTRKFWTWINWVPFQADFFGEVCSEFIDEVYTAGGRDLFPGRSEQATVPGDFAKCGKLVIL
jgi:hypothetical protein